jgi:hypothetical protein
MYTWGTYIHLNNQGDTDMTTILKTFTGTKYTVKVRALSPDYFIVVYVSNKTGWHACARTRGYRDYGTHSEAAAIRKARALHAELG